MARQILRFLPFAILLLCFSAMLYAGPGAEEALTIYYTSSLNGNLDGCECKTSPKSGLVKSAVFLRQRNRETSILIDSGDVFPPMGDTAIGSHLAQLYGELGYDVVAVGDQEFVNGFGGVLEASLPYLSHNVQICPDENSCIFVSLTPKVLQKNSLSVGIDSVIDPEVFFFNDEEFKQIVKVTPPEDSARSGLEFLQAENTDLSILLYHGPTHNALTLAENTPGYDLMIVGHDQRLIEAERINNTVVVSPGEEGNRVGVLKIYREKDGSFTIKNTFQTFSYTEDPDDEVVRSHIGEYIKALTSSLKKGG